MTGIYQTKDEMQARRVLGSAASLGVDLRFSLHDGWYSILVVPAVDDRDAARLARLARTLANTDLRGIPLSPHLQID